MPKIPGVKASTAISLRKSKRLSRRPNCTLVLNTDLSQSSVSRNAFAAGFTMKCGYPDLRHGKLFGQLGGRQISLKAELHQMVSKLARPISCGPGSKQVEGASR
jgi:hypothetical protein